MSNLKYVLQNGLGILAVNPVKNDFLVEGGKINYSRLDALDGYTVPITARDYSAKTPLMWNAIYERTGLKLRNIMLVVEKSKLHQVVQAFREDPKYLGGGVASGLKEAVIPLLDEIIPSDLRSVNIVVKEQGRLIGYNTDAQGFFQSLEEKLADNGRKISGAHVVIFGAGGVAKQVSDLIANHQPRRISIINRTVNNGLKLGYELAQKYPRTEFVVSGEDGIRGISLNTVVEPTVFINLTDKGSDEIDKSTGVSMVNKTCFAPVLEGDEYNRSIALDLLRVLLKQNPQAIIADITLPQGAWPATLHWAEVAGFNRKQLLNGIPMVVNQAAPAYLLIQKAFPNMHTVKYAEKEILAMLKQATDLK